MRFLVNSKKYIFSRNKENDDPQDNEKNHFNLNGDANSTVRNVRKNYKKINPSNVRYKHVIMTSYSGDTNKLINFKLKIIKTKP